MLDRLFGRRRGEHDFSGKIVLVTGAASGIGRGVALAFARAGSDLVLVDVDGGRLRETADMVEASGSRCLAKRVDVSSRSQMEAMAGEVLSDWGRVDILINNAGVGVGGELVNIPMEDLEWIVGINLMGEIYGTRLFLPRMIERGEGHIVNVASLSGLVLLPFHLAYTTTKFGLTGFSTALWAETKRHGVGVTLVCPGAVKTNIMEHTRAHAGGDKQEEATERFGRLLQERGKSPDEAAAFILDAVAAKRFLCLMGAEAYILYYLTRLSPGFMRRLVASITGLLSKG
ncbi:MAG: SDR family NAD(P)-dependent oxidoreductase [Actinomycetota bacterium]|nr:SDR family NAD(P)-dependent oxidoreductase [Actinomycetota bacterium]